MRTRREQMQAYRFVIRRIVAAVLSGEPETIDRPMRRLGLSLFASSMVAVIALAAFGIWGWITEQGQPPEIGDLLIEQGTGTIYVVLPDDLRPEGRLHPVYNIASARLLLGEPGEPKNVSASSLVDEPRGRLLGIPDAPEALPDPDDLLGLPWQVCGVPPGASSTEPITAVVIDRELSGEPLGEQGLHVVAGDVHYLLWNNAGLPISRNPEVAMFAFGLPREGFEVGEPLITSLNPGPEFGPPQLPGLGDDSGFVINGRQLVIGELLEIGGDNFMVTSDGLGGINRVTRKLLEDTERVPVRSVIAADAEHIDDVGPLEPEGFPDSTLQPHPSADDRPTVCSAYVGGPDSGPAGTTIEIFDSPPDALLDESLNVDQTPRDSVPVADRVVIAGGRGMLAKAISHAGTESAGDTLYLITDQRLKYPLTPEAKEALGYGDVDPVPIPENQLALVPTGPSLNQAAAYGDLGPAEASGTGSPEPDQGG
jgi:type VII secretion protein EccB